MYRLVLMRNLHRYQILQDGIYDDLVASSDKISFSTIKKEVTCSMVVLALLSSEALCPSPPEKKLKIKTAIDQVINR